MIFPIGEIRDEILPDLTSHIFAHIGVECLPMADYIKSSQPDGEQLTLIVADFVLTCMVNLCFHPLTVHAIFREHKKELVVYPDRFGYLLEEFPTALDVL